MTSRLEGRNGQIYREFILGKTQAAIAEKHGLSQQRVHQIVREVLASIPEEDLSDARKKMLDVMGVLSDTMAELMDAPPTQAYSNGRPMFEPDGVTPILDHTTRVQAADRVLKVAERIAKLQGLDASQKVDVTMSEQAKEAAAAAAAEAVAFLSATDE